MATLRAGVPRRVRRIHLPHSGTSVKAMTVENDDERAGGDGGDELGANSNDGIGISQGWCSMSFAHEVKWVHSKFHSHHLVAMLGTRTVLGSEGDSEETS